MKRVMEESAREEEERQKALKGAGAANVEAPQAAQPEAAVDDKSAAMAAELARQKALLDEREAQLKALMEENKRAKQLADDTLAQKERELAERERQLNEQSAMSKQELEAERKRIAEERA